MSILVGVQRSRRAIFGVDGRRPWKFAVPRWGLFANTRLGQLIALASINYNINGPMVLMPFIGGVLASLGKAKVQLGPTYLIAVCGVTYQIVALSGAGKSTGITKISKLADLV